TAGLLRRHDPTAGLVVVHPTPAGITSQDLGHDLLRALGRPIHRLAAERLQGSRPAWRAVAAWLHADQLSDLIVLRAHLLGADRWSQLIELSRGTGTRLTLVCHTRSIPSPLAQALTKIDHRILTNLELLDLPAGGHRPSAPPAADPGMASLPRVTYPGVINFRRYAFDQLGPIEFARFDTIYRSAQETTLAWLDGRPDAATSDDEREAAMGLLSELVHDSPSRTHTLARLRGAQAAFRWHGFKLTLPASRDLLDVLAGPGLTSQPVTDQLLAQIRANVAHKAIAAALATSLFTGLAPTSLMPLTWKSLTPGADRLRIINRVSRLQRPAPNVWPRRTLVRVPATFYVPTAVRPLFQAARAFIPPDENIRHRLFWGATPHQIEAMASECAITLPHQEAPAIAWQAWIEIERVDYFGGQYDVDFSADQQFQPQPAPIEPSATLER
ncbi:hypothetical protein ACFFIO_17245, partial [Citricoccus parietis]